MSVTLQSVEARALLLNIAAAIARGRLGEPTGAENGSQVDDDATADDGGEDQPPSAPARSSRTGIGQVLTVREAAHEAGWLCGANLRRRCRCKVCLAGNARMLRMLRTVDRESGGMVLRNIGAGTRPHWVVGAGAMRRLLPQLAKEGEHDATMEVERLFGKLHGQEVLVRLAHEHIGELRGALAVKDAELAELREAVRTLLKTVVALRGDSCDAQRREATPDTDPRGRIEVAALEHSVSDGTTSVESTSGHGRTRAGTPCSDPK